MESRTPTGSQATSAVPATVEEERGEVSFWVGNVITLAACRVVDEGGAAVMRREGTVWYRQSTEKLSIWPVAETGKEAGL